MSKISENHNNFHCRRHLVEKALRKPQRCHRLAIFDSKRRLFRLSTSATVDIHLVRVPQDVDVVNVR